MREPGVDGSGKAPEGTAKRHGVDESGEGSPRPGLDEGLGWLGMWDTWFCKVLG